MDGEENRCPFRELLSRPSQDRDLVVEDHAKVVSRVGVVVHVEEAVAEPDPEALQSYDLVHCPTRARMDLFGDPSEKDPVSHFIQLLWEKGTTFEAEVIEGLEIEYTDLRELSPEEREAQTEEAMARGDELIYQGRISAGDLVGQPDLLRREGHGYVAGDIKSGAGQEGGSDLEDGKPKRHYAVQL